jgi:hypothetical protein
MDAEYSKEKMVHMHEDIVRLKVTIKSQRTCIRILRVLAIVGWGAFLVSLVVSA